MSEADPCSAYLHLAEKVFKHEVKPNMLSAYLRDLPLLNRELLNKLAEESEKISLTQPRMSWAICYVFEKASRQQKLDLFTRSLAAWYLGRAANCWVQPKRTAKAITRARRGFVKIGDAGWIAACDWMENRFPWELHGLPESENILSKVINIFKETGFVDFLPNCLLDIAQIQILLDKLEKAEKNIFDSRLIFKKNDDKLNEGRCWVVLANCYRRRSQFKKALHFLSRSENIFNKLDSSLDLAKLNYYRGIINLLSTTDYQLTSNSFILSINIFTKMDLPFWKAMGFSYLGMVNMQTGQLLQATKYFNKAELIYNKFNPNIYIAQNFTAFGKLNSILGNCDIAISQLLQAKTINIQNGRTLDVGIDISSIGETYFIQGRYQDAIYEFETANDYFSNQNDKSRLGVYQLTLANYWLNLQQYDHALSQLESAELNLSYTNQTDATVSIELLRAKIYFGQNKLLKTQHHILHALDIARQFNLQPQIAMAELYLSEFYLETHKEEVALEHSFSAQRKFQSFGMSYEESACKIIIANCLLRLKKEQEAEFYLKSALTISNGKYEELDWQIFAGLAQLSPIESAINMYYKAMETLIHIRSNFWQPQLSDTYRTKKTQFINHAISFSIQHENPKDVLCFIESEKTNSLIQQLKLSITNKAFKESKEKAKLSSEISRIKRQINTLLPSSNFSPEIHLLQKEMTETYVKYDEIVGSLERLNNKIENPTKLSLFSLQDFIDEANKRFNKNWVVLEYYILDGQIIIIIITKNECKQKVILKNNRLEQLLKLIQFSQQDQKSFSQNEFSELGNYLLPDDVLNELSPDSTLIIVPHQKLHNIPWAALGENPLVLKCIPLICPSLELLKFLWNRSEPDTPMAQSKGVMIGISEFNERYQDLSFVEKEIVKIHSILNNNDDVFTNVMNFEDLKNIFNSSQNQSRYIWLHLATHFFTDNKTGRIGGFSLKNQDVLLDQIRDLKSFPPVVTLSGCSSLFSYILSSDEQIGVTSTCFLAGANTIIGSVWPVVDGSTIPLMLDYYFYISKRIKPSEALALAQRNAINLGKNENFWSSFLCIGAGI